MSRQDPTQLVEVTLKRIVRMPKEITGIPPVLMPAGEHGWSELLARVDRIRTISLGANGVSLRGWGVYLTAFFITTNVLVGLCALEKSLRRAEML